MKIIRKQLPRLLVRITSRRHLVSFVSVVTLLVGVAFWSTAPATAETADQSAVAKLLHGMFDKPDSLLIIAPIVVSGDYAIAGWTQGEMGGRALLRKKEQQWALILCAGDEIKSAHALTVAGLPNQDAATLEHDLAAAEDTLPKQHVAMFSRFQGIMRMDGADDEHHAHHDHDANH